jgi:hypothetical protein
MEGALYEENTCSVIIGHIAGNANLLFPLVRSPNAFVITKVAQF